MPPLRAQAGCLIDAKGSPAHLAGDAAWSLVVRLTADERRLYLTDRRARGFNTVLVNLIEHKFGGPTDIAGNAPFLSPGAFDRPNPRYFDRAAQVIEDAAAAGFVVLLAPAYLGVNDEGWFEELVRAGPEGARAYGAWVGARFARFANIVWVDGGDRTPDQARPMVDAIAQAIRAAAPAQLHTAHSFRNRSAAEDYTAPWLSVNTTYASCDKLGSRLWTDARRPQPFLLVEGVYENEGADLRCLAAQVWEPLLAGAQGSVFGNAPIWKFGKGWEDALDSPGSRMVQHLARFLSQRPLPGLAPEPWLGAVRGGWFRFDLAAARARDSTLVAFVPDGPRTIRVDLGEGPAAVFWLNPVSGEVVRPPLPATQGWVSLATPDAGPWVLVAEDARLGRAPPGLLRAP